MDDLPVDGGFTLTAEQLVEQLEFAIASNHAHCYFQLFSYQERKGKKTYVVTVIDLYDPLTPTRTVNDDAEFVTKQALKYANHNAPYEDLLDLIIIYRDVMGNWEELRHNRGNFYAYRHLDAKDVDIASQKAIAFHELDRHGGSTQTH